jgi:hypothetical protein
VSGFPLYLFYLNLVRYIYVLNKVKLSPWPRPEFLATDSEARGRFPALREKKVVGLERGSLSLVSTTEELLDRKVPAPV